MMPHDSVIEQTVRNCNLPFKLPGVGYGYLPPREARLVPWEEVAVDLIGPWSIHVGNMELKFQALTCIDTTTNLVELVRLDDKQGNTVATKFDHTWLARYPWPTRIIHDNGPEFIDGRFQNLLRRIGASD